MAINYLRRMLTTLQTSGGAVRTTQDIGLLCPTEPGRIVALCGSTFLGYSCLPLVKSIAKFADQAIH